ncbi:hypothetical protein CLV62_10812 [Dysgonomonas alginatilytica]|uniref:Uncharacterized protein n=1 Tax=Dysgonomonas alginatilytica TaxID=1605892 RepID=A0A2V3PWS2_9BACT|nr:hypothetical protein [Dysgonomonas alginatilytica]PXV65014.1 hypothetical protein CLV62_10812 [Dysgonomonas alginatilytica]
MKSLKNVFILIAILMPTVLFAQKEMTIEQISRTTDYYEDGKACFEIISTDSDIKPRSVMEDFEKTQLPDGTYSYKAILDIESGKKRKFYIAAPLVIEQEYNVTGLQPKEYIKVRVTIPKNELTLIEKDNLIPSKNSNAIYQFFANIDDMQIITNEGLKFINQGKNESSFYVYELSIPVSGASKLNVTIKAAGYEDFSYEMTDIAQRVYGFFIFPKKECFNKNFELGNEYFRDGAYTDAIRYYKEAEGCKDRPEGTSLSSKVEEAKRYEKIKSKIDEYDRNVQKLSLFQDEDFDSEVDSMYWYKNTVIALMRHLLKQNPSDKFCANALIEKREEDLLNSSRTIGGLVTDIEYQNQYLSNVIIYGSEDPDADKKKMMRLGQTDTKGIFRIKVPNRYKVLYFEHSDNNYNKPIRIDITNGKRYKYHVKLQRKVMGVGI